MANYSLFMETKRSAGKVENVQRGNCILNIYLRNRHVGQSERMSEGGKDTGLAIWMSSVEKDLYLGAAWCFNYIHKQLSVFSPCCPASAYCNDVCDMEKRTGAAIGPAHSYSINVFLTNLSSASQNKLHSMRCLHEAVFHLLSKMYIII